MTQNVPNGSLIPFLQTHAAGTALYDVSDALEAVAKAVALTGRKGKLRLEIAIKPAGRASGALEYEVEVTKAMPKPDRLTSIWFVDPETGAMTRDNPRQLAMQFKAVERPAVDVNPATARATNG